MIVPLLALAAVTALHAATPVALSPSGWSAWAPRTEIAPRTWVDHLHQRTPAGALAISGNSNPAAYGGWHHRVEGIQPGKWERDKAGNPHSMSGLPLSAADAAKLGQLVLDQGRWNGQQLLPAAFVREMLAKSKLVQESGQRRLLYAILDADAINAARNK